ncbi:MAG TPA: CvpA family protein [bacterium]|nr:CvpA family protein [bacterium]
MLTYFDAVLYVLLIASGLWSAYRGLVREAFALLALIIGVAIAAGCYGLVMPFLAGWLGTGLLARALAYVILFAVAVLVVVAAGRVLQTVLQVMLLGWLDRCGGFVVGVVKALFIIGMVLLLADRIPAVHAALVRHSDLAPFLLKCARFAFRLIPALFSRFAADFA